MPHTGPSGLMKEIFENLGEVLAKQFEINEDSLTCVEIRAGDVYREWKIQDDAGIMDQYMLLLPVENIKADKIRFRNELAKDSKYTGYKTLESGLIVPEFIVRRSGIKSSLYTPKDIMVCTSPLNIYLKN